MCNLIQAQKQKQHCYCWCSCMFPYSHFPEYKIWTRRWVKSEGNDRILNKIYKGGFSSLSIFYCKIQPRTPLSMCWRLYSRFWLFLLVTIFINRCIHAIYHQLARFMRVTEILLGRKVRTGIARVEITFLRFLNSENVWNDFVVFTRGRWIR